MPSRFATALLAVIALSLVACDTSGDATGTTTPPTTTPAEPTTSQPAETTTSEVAPQPEGMGDLPEEVAAQITELSAVVEDLRGLEFLEEPKVKVVTTEELAQLVQEDIEENVEDLDTDEALDVLLGLIEPGTSLLDTYLELYGEQVAGFYDTDTKELVVPLRDESFSALERSTIVHELVHALTDQHFDLDASYDTLYDEQRYDEALAFQALIEGDAVATEFTHLMGMSFEEQQQLFEDSLEADTTALEAAPRFLQESLIFPYTTGREFVDSLMAAGGQEAVNQAYSEPPISTEQVITPADYQVDQPVPVSLEITVPDGYELIYDAVWGELGFEIMFNQILGGRPEAADGWGGDQYVTYFDGTDVVMALRFVGDAEEDAAEMTDALLAYVEAGMDVGDGEDRDEARWYSGEDFAFVDRQGAEVVWVVASDPEVGESVAGQLVEANA